MRLIMFFLHPAELALLCYTVIPHR